MLVRAATFVLAVIALAGECLGSPITEVSVAKTVTISNKHPLIYYHGRWDTAPATWWAGSGFKLSVANLRTLTLHLGLNTTSPYVPVGVSVNYAPFVNYNLTVGANVLDVSSATKLGPTVVRVNSQGWQNNRLHLQSIEINADAVVLPYKPAKRAFYFVGDSLSAGQYLPQGVDQAWPFLVGEDLRAEHTVIAQPGATLTDMQSYGNVHGISFQFFRTEDTGYIWTEGHNYTTPWDFRRDVPTPTHLVIHIGANDASWNVPASNFTETYLTFITRLRKMWPTQPLFVFTPFGWPSPDGSVYYYYDGVYAQIVDARHAAGDKNVYLVDTTGWIGYSDVFPDNIHPNVEGHAKIAAKFEAWLENWGLHKGTSW